MKRRRTHSDTDVCLLKQAGRGDKNAFGQLYMRYFRTVKDFLVSQNGHNCSPDDLAQEVFTRAWQRAGRFKGDSSVKTYLFGVALNVAREEVAKTRLRLRSLLLRDGPSLPPLEPPDGTGGLTEPKAAARCQELHQAATKRLALLPPKSRQAIESLILQNLSPKDAASMAGCSPKILVQRARRALKLLRDALDGPS